MMPSIPEAHADKGGIPNSNGTYLEEIVVTDCISPHSIADVVGQLINAALACYGNMMVHVFLNRDTLTQRALVLICFRNNCKDVSFLLENRKTIFGTDTH